MQGSEYQLKGDFGKRNGSGKLWKRIRQVLKTGMLKVFLEYNAGEQISQSHQSRIKRYDITNRASNQSVPQISSETW